MWSVRRVRGYDPPALLDRRNRRLLLLPAALACLTALALALAPAALAGPVTPESGGSPNADDIDTLYRVVLYVAIVIFVLVEGVLIWSLVRFRYKRGGPEAQQIRGNTPLEVSWTLGAALILVVLTVVTFIYLPDIKDPPASGPDGLSRASGTQFATVDQPEPPTSGDRNLTIQVNGQQYLWRYDYPGDQQLFSYFTMVVPTNTTVVLRITSSDVIHSWWIPKLGPKFDAVPGHVNESWFKIKRPGSYHGQCAELCGAGHADMRAVVKAVPPAEYVAWARRQRRDIEAAKTELSQSRREIERRPEL
jgi:cytochrome c oxidase subunit 2